MKYIYYTVVKRNIWAEKNDDFGGKEVAEKSFSKNFFFFFSTRDEKKLA